MEICSNGVTRFALDFNKITLAAVSREEGSAPYPQGRNKTSYEALAIIQVGPIVAWRKAVAEEVVRSRQSHCLLKRCQIWNNRSDFISKRGIRMTPSFVPGKSEG